MRNQAYAAALDDVALFESFEIMDVDAVQHHDDSV